jgi:hypothetical protein
MDGGNGYSDSTSLPVMNSRVWFSPDAGSLFNGESGAAAVFTDGEPLNPSYEFNGFARGTWTLNTAGWHTLRVSGVGYAENPPLGSTIPEGQDQLPPWMDPVSPMPYGFEFTVLACDRPSPELAAVDGEVKTGEYSYTQDFFANLSGDPAAEASLHVRNDCENLYLGLTVARDGDEKINTWRIDLDDDQNGRSVGDDIMIVDVSDGLATVSDLWMTSSCINKKQASCGETDGDPMGTDKIATFTNSNSLWTYEVAIPLSNGSSQDIDLPIGSGATVGVSITLQIGNGAQGNTQVPGFKQYYDYIVNP